MKNSLELLVFKRSRRISFLLFILFLTLPAIEQTMSVQSEAYAEDSEVIQQLEQRVRDLEEKTSDMTTKQEHTDKHILHMKETLPKVIDGLSIGGE